MNLFIDYEYDSELEVSETQFETMETGEMSHEDESVSVLADRVFPIHVARRSQGCGTDHINRSGTGNIATFDEL